MKNKICALIFAFFSGTLLAQMDKLDRVRSEIGIQWKPEIRISSGVSMPLSGQFGFDKYPSARSYCAANTGFFIETSVQHRFKSNALWSVQGTLGYLHHGFPNELVADETEGDADFISGNAWNTLYLMPSVAFRGGVRFKFELQVGGGVGLVMGGNPTVFSSSRQSTQAINRIWTYRAQIAGGFRLGLSLGWQLNKRWLIFAETNWIVLGRERIGTLVEETYDIDSTSHLAIKPAKFTGEYKVQQTLNVNVLQIGLGIKYQIYKYLYPKESERKLKYY